MKEKKKSCVDSWRHQIKLRQRCIDCSFVPFNITHSPTDNRPKQILIKSWNCRNFVKPSVTVTDYYILWNNIYSNKLFDIQSMLKIAKTYSGRHNCDHYTHYITILFLRIILVSRHTSNNHNIRSAKLKLAHFPFFAAVKTIRKFETIITELVVISKFSTSSREITWISRLN